MEVNVGKKKFRLDDVSILISEMYSDLTQMAYDLSDGESAIEEIEAQYEADLEDGISVAKAKLKRIRAIKDLRAEAKCITSKIFDARFFILEEVLALNGYEFDREYWRKSASVELVNDILVGLLSPKDKKKVTSPSI